MSVLKTFEEIENLREGGKILASILLEAGKVALPGVKTIELDSLAEKLIRQAGGLPSFKNYKTRDDKVPYPASLCVSINEEVVHGIPGNIELQEGDIVSLDLGMKYKGLYTDSAITIPVGKISGKAGKLIDTAKKSLEEGISAVCAGARIGDIGQAIQQYAEKNGFSVIRKLVGHGLGYKPHEPPEVPNFGRKGTGTLLKEGMVIAIEPMISAGSYDIDLADDLWTWKTKDGSLSAHFEHTVLVTKEGAEVITKIN